MAGQSFKLLLVMLAVTAQAGAAQADPLAPEVSKSDNERLLPGIYPAPPVPEGFGVADEPGQKPFHLDWSVGLKGTITSTTNGSSFVTTLNPQFTATHAGRRMDIVVDGAAELARSQDGAIAVPALRLGLSTTTELDRDTRLDAETTLELTRQLPGSVGLDPRVIEAPQVLSGALGLGVERSFGRFNLGVRGDAARVVYGATQRSDTGLTDNSDQNLWRGEASLRLGYQLTPILEVFGQASVERSWFDQASPTLGVRTDATDRALRAGLAGKWNGIVTASASVGVGQHDFDASSLSDITTQLYDASLTFTPDPKLNLTAAFSTRVEPTGTDTSGTARVTHLASAKADYVVNSWLRLRAKADWGNSVLEGSGETERRYGFGAGADYKFNSRTALSADYVYDHRDNSRTGPNDAQIVSLGITLRR